MSDCYGSIKAIIKGPRWARCDEFLKDLTFQMGLEIQVERDTCLLRESVRYKVKGMKSELVLFEREVNSVLSEWNRG
jgi:hypothetical protein